MWSKKIVLCRGENKKKGAREREIIREEREREREREGGERER